MRTYNYSERWKELLTPEIVMYLTKISEFKGEQKLYVQAKRDTLGHLVEIAKIQSTESSNKMEGIYTTDERLRALVREKTNPHNRDEREIAGYRDVLDLIHENYNYIPINPAYILQMHSILYKYESSGHGGFYKSVDNIIQEIDSEGNKSTRFTPVSAWETAYAVESLCKEFNDVLNKDEAEPLIIIPMFILDFLCIHPFNDGNGRMSRLLTLLLLYRSGYMVGKYISLEKLIEGSKELYYQSLQDSSSNWHEESNDYIPFVKYILGIIIAAYREFDDRVAALETDNKTKPEQVKEVIRNAIGTITKSEIMEQCYDISQVTIQRALADLVSSGEIIKIGDRKFTKYIWNHNKNEEETK